MVASPRNLISAVVRNKGLWLSKVSMSFCVAPSSCIRTIPYERGPGCFLSKQLYSHGLGLHGSKTGNLRRLRGITFAVFRSLLSEDSVRGMEKLAFRPEGYNFWTWRGHKIHYVEQGQGLPIVLIHGFGASAFHWRYNIPVLAKKYKVYALDLLGFGWSDKAIIEYDAIIWRDQVIDFMKDIVKDPAILVGNSLGGFAALFTAAELPQLFRGLVLLNTAGQFGDSNIKTAINYEESAINKYIVNPLKQAFQGVFLGFLFWQAKQPERVKTVLKSIYINTSNVDDYLVESIIRPAGDPNAGEVYYRLMTRFMLNQRKYTLDILLQKLSCPLLLLWGDLDPWVGTGIAIRIKEVYPITSVVNLKAGHCPHDEVPELVNKALIDWLTSLDHEASLEMAQT